MQFTLSSPDQASLPEKPAIIPIVDSLGPFTWGAFAKAMEKGLHVPLGQPWRECPEPGFLPGHIWMGLQDNDLLVYAVLQDEKPSNTATRRNEMTWTTGDVVELFLQAENIPYYYEFHVTPENQRLQLRYPYAGTSSDRSPIEKFMLEKDLFESHTSINSNQTQWCLFLRTNLEALFGSRPEGLRFLIGRYDVQPNHSQPVLSSSGNLTICAFHHAAEWSSAKLAAPLSNGPG